MTENQVQQIIDFIMDIGNAMAVEGFAIAYRRALFIGYSWIAFGVILLILSAVTFYGYKIAKTHNEREINAMLGMFMIVFSIPAFYVGLDFLINTEFRAVIMLRNIMTMRGF